jgi:hypothetical protein
MEFNGDEKRIQALFSELALDDQSHAPRFDEVWPRATRTAPVPAPLLTRFAIVVLAGVCLIAIWSWYRSSQPEQVANIPPQIIPESRGRQPEQLLSADAKEVRAVRPRRPLRQRQSERIEIRQAAVLSSWQSPTNILLNSPTASVLSSLPQLNQSARDLEQFLPKNNEVMKESKQ